jgi:hypothetical protein
LPLEEPATELLTDKNKDNYNINNNNIDKHVNKALYYLNKIKRSLSLVEDNITKVLAFKTEN